MCMYFITLGHPHRYHRQLVLKTASIICSLTNYTKFDWLQLQNTDVLKLYKTMLVGIQSHITAPGTCPLFRTIDHVVLSSYYTVTKIAITF